MVILTNSTKYPTALLKKLVKLVAKRIGYWKPVLVRAKEFIIDSDGKHAAGQAQQGSWGIHAIDIEVPHVSTETPQTFLRNLLHEFGHLKDYDYDRNRSKMAWSCQTEEYRKNKNRGEWADRPEEKRAILHSDLYKFLHHDNQICGLLEQFDRSLYGK